MMNHQKEAARPFNTEAHVHPMSQAEMDQFLTIAPIGRLGMITSEGPYIIPVGYCYTEGKIFIHMCQEGGRKIKALKANPIVCFEVDESLSDVSLAKSIVITGLAEIISEPKLMIPYLKLHIDKYRVSRPFAEYVRRNNRHEKAIERYGKPELEVVRICRITPHEMSGRRIVRTNF